MVLLNKLTVVDFNTKFISKLDLCKIWSKQSKSLQPKTNLTLSNYSIKPIKKFLITLARVYLIVAKKSVISLVKISLGTKRYNLKNLNILNFLSSQKAKCILLSRMMNLLSSARQVYKWTYYKPWVSL